MEHGLLFLSHSDIVDAETNYLDGEYTLDLNVTTWNYSQGRNSWWGPTWSGRNGGSDTLDNKKQDIFNAFQGTSRKFGHFYPISELDDKSDYQASANGAYVSEWQGWAQELVDQGLGDTIIRPNPEHTRSWSDRYPLDPETGDPAPEQFADAFARCVDAFHSIGGVDNDITGSDFKFLYSPSGWQLDLTEECWPVDSSFWPSGVDPPIVCPSIYNKSYIYTNYTTTEIQNLSESEYESVSLQAWNEQIVDMIDSYRNWADSVNAPLGNVEWGVHTLKPERGPESWGDDPYFMHRMFDYMENHNFVFEHPWNVTQNTSGSSQLWPPDEDLDRARGVWKQRVLSDAGSQPLGNFNVKQSGSAVEPAAVRVNQSGTAADSTVYLNENGDPVEVFPGE